jgi:DoxX-like family
MNTPDVSYAVDTMPGSPATAASGSAIWLGRVSSGLVIFLMLLDGAIKLLPWPMVTEAMDRMGYGSSESLARFLGSISLMGTALYAFPPTSFVGAILTTGYLGSALVSHVRIESAMFTDILCALYLGIVLFGGPWLRDRFTYSPLAS